MAFVFRRRAAWSGESTRSRATSFTSEALEPRVFLSVEMPFQQASYPFPGSNDNRRALQFDVPAGFVEDVGPTDDTSDHNDATYQWPEPKIMQLPNPAGGTAVASAASDMLVTIDFVTMGPNDSVTSLMADLLQARVSGEYRIVRQPDNDQITWNIQGGGLGGRSFTLHGQSAMLRDSKSIGNAVETDGTVIQYVFPAGHSYVGEAQFFQVSVMVSSSIATGDPGTIPMGLAMATLLGGTPSAYDEARVNEIASHLKFNGAIPDALMLYDFSGLTAPPPQQVPYVSQHDQPTLPIQFGVHGGNGCGPSSLAMALSEVGRPTPLATVYDKTMQIGLNVAPNTAQQFDWNKGRDYAQGLLSQTHGVLFRWGDTWSRIDANLKADRQVILGTNLSQGTGAGTGHVMLLLAVGDDPDVKRGLAEVYPGDSGDYYIVCDPAGHYFADPFTGGFNAGHYGTMAGLRALAKGLNYGGGFAIYPKEELQSRVDPVRTLTIGPTDPALDVRVHSPVSVVITDPAGRRSGILSDGSVLNEIPDGGYQEAVGEEFGNNTRTFYPEEEKGVILNNPAAGTYQVELVGTGSGPFHLDINTLQGGAAPTTTAYSGTASPGGVYRYTFTVGGAGTPQLQNVFADSTGWSPSFRQYLQATGAGDAALGYRVAAGDTLPWVNVDRIVMRFDRDLPERALPARVTVDGVRADYGAVPSTLDPRSILLTFDRPLVADRLRLVDNALGGALDFRFNALPGDADRSGAVLANDFSEVKKKFFATAVNPGSGAAGYSIFHDVTGSGSILADDFSEVKKRFFNALPAAATAAPTPEAMAARDPSDLRRVDGLLA